MIKEIPKGQYGFPVITISPKEYLDKGAEVILKAMEPVGKAITKFIVAPLHGATSYATTGLYRTKEKAKELQLKEKAFEEHIAPALSPSNHVVAWTQGSMNPKVGLRKIAEWGPLALLGSLGVDAIGFKYVPKVVKGTPKAVVDVAAKAGNKTAKKAVVAREIKLGIKLNTKNGRIEVSDNYFNAPDKWYRITETPEKYGIMELGKNVTTHDAPKTLGTINGWRSSVLNAKVTKGPEGFIKKPSKIELNIRRKNGQAHGNTSLAAKGKLWGGTTSGSRLFPEGVIEGQAPSVINYGVDRTNFVVTPWEEVPNGGRVGFHTGEMPMSNLGWFQKTNKGTYTYEPIIPEKRISYQPKSLLESSTSLAFFERQPSKISRSERAGVPKLERNFTPKRHIAYYPGYQLKGLMKGSPLEKQLSKAGTINVKLLRAHFNKASQIERDIVNQVLEDKIWGDNIDYNKFKKAVLDELITYDRKPQTKYSDYGMNRIGYDGDIRVPNNFSGYMEVALYKFPNRFLRKSSTEFIDTETGQSITPFNFHDYDNTVIASLLKDKVTKNTFTFESPKLPLGNSKHYDASTLGHSRTYTTPEEPKVLHVLESQSDWGQTKLGNNTAPYTGTPEYLNNPTAYRKFIDDHKRLLAKMLANPSDYQAGSIERQIANIEHHEAILKLMLKQEGWNPLAKYLHDNYLQRQLQENLKYASEHGQTLMRYPTPETAAKIEGYTAKLQWYSPTGERLDMRNLEYDTEIGDFEYPEGSIVKNEYSPLHQTILKKYADFPKMFQKLFRGHPVEIVTDSKGNTWYLVNVPKGYLNKEWLYKKGGKTHKPFGHRSVLDNGWQSTKLLKNKKNVYGK